MIRVVMPSVTAGVANGAGPGQGKGAAAVPVTGALEGPQPEGLVGGVAHLPAGSCPEAAESRAALA